jgi:hypothetical protein
MINLQERTQDLESQLIHVLDTGGFHYFKQTERNVLCAHACFLSIEHASSLRLLLSNDHSTSATALLRLQFEAFIRAAWLLYVANDVQISKLSAPLTQKSQQAANNFPGLSDMLKAIELHAPPGLVTPMLEFKNGLLKGLNSFVHSGIHPLALQKVEFPQTLMRELLLNSNGIMHFSYRMLASLTGSKALLDEVTHLYKPFSECFPPPKANGHIEG